MLYRMPNKILKMPFSPVINSVRGKISFHIWYMKCRKAKFTIWCVWLTAYVLIKNLHEVSSLAPASDSMK